MRYLPIDILVPPWANWIAQDASGEWYWFAIYPTPNKARKEWATKDSFAYFKAHDGIPPLNWLQEVYEIN